MISKIAGRVRGLFAGNYPENREDEQFHLNNRGDQLIAQALPELTEVVRLGWSWQVKNTTGLSSGTALPTTTSGLTIWNGEADTGKCYAIDSVACWEGVVDATQSDQTGLFAMMNQGKVAVPTGTAVTPISLAARSNYDGAATCLAAATVANGGWYPIGTSAPSSVTAVAGAIWKCVDVPVKGLYLVRPGGTFSVQSVKVAAAAAQMFFTIRWHEVQIPYRS